MPFHNPEDLQRMLSESIQDFAQNILGISEIAILLETTKIEPETKGSSLTISSPSALFQISVVGEEKKIQNLARQLLGKTAEEAMTSGECFDAIGEACNIIAGGMKRQLNEECGGMQLGLPARVSGEAILSNGGQEMHLKCVVENISFVVVCVTKTETKEKV